METNLGYRQALSGKKRSLACVDLIRNKMCSGSIKHLDSFWCSRFLVKLKSRVIELPWCSCKSKRSDSSCLWILVLPWTERDACQERVAMSFVVTVALEPGSHGSSAAEVGCNRYRGHREGGGMLRSYVVPSDCLQCSLGGRCIEIASLVQLNNQGLASIGPDTSPL